MPVAMIFYICQGKKGRKSFAAFLTACLSDLLTASTWPNTSHYWGQHCNYWQAVVPPFQLWAALCGLNWSAGDSSELNGQKSNEVDPNMWIIMKRERDGKCHRCGWDPFILLSLSFQALCWTYVPKPERYLTNCESWLDDYGPEKTLKSMITFHLT